MKADHQAERPSRGRCSGHGNGVAARSGPDCYGSSITCQLAAERRRGGGGGQGHQGQIAGFGTVEIAAGSAGWRPIIERMTEPF